MKTPDKKDTAIQAFLKIKEAIKLLRSIGFQESETAFDKLISAMHALDDEIERMPGK